jgi:endonuclease YncB( thermonuclease family)
MVMKTATVVEVMDGGSFRLRTDAIVVVDGLTLPEKGSEKGLKAKQKLEELILKKKVQYESMSWDQLGRTRAKVTVDGMDVNQAMKDYLDSL